MTMPFQKVRTLLLTALLLAACLAAGCGQTEEANKLVDEINALATKGGELVKQANASMRKANGLNFETDRDELRRLGREYSDLFRQARDQHRQAAEKAEQASKLDVADWYKNYFTLFAQGHRKQAEVLDLYSQEGDITASDRPPAEINKQSAELVARAEKLTKETEDIMAQVNKIEEEHKDDIKKE